MTRATIILFLICFLTCLNSSLVWSLLCAQCTQADPGCRNGNIRPTTCETSHRYCYVLHIYSDSRQGTFRGCTDRYDSVEGCTPVVVNQREGTACTTVCDWDGCNSSHRAVRAYIDGSR